MKDLFAKSELLRLFKELDTLLVESVSLYIIGGANLIAFGVSERHTQDVDVISPSSFSEDLLRCISALSKKEGLAEDWINSMPSRDEPYLTKGWRDRSIEFFIGAKLRIYLLNRRDMVGLKLAAALDRRDPDIEDLLRIDPTEEEWEFGRNWARNYDSNPHWPELIDQLVLELKRKQHG